MLASCSYIAVHQVLTVHVKHTEINRQQVIPENLQQKKTHRLYSYRWILGPMGPRTCMVSQIRYAHKQNTVGWLSPPTLYARSSETVNTLIGSIIQHLHDKWLGGMPVQENHFFRITSCGFQGVKLSWIAANLWKLKIQYTLQHPSPINPTLPSSPILVYGLVFPCMHLGFTL